MVVHHVRQVAELSIRRWFSSVGATLEAFALTGFALARTAPQAAAANAMVCAAYTLHHGGWSANLLEVGGKDTPVMNAFSNILNNFPVRPQSTPVATGGSLSPTPTPTP